MATKPAPLPGAEGLWTRRLWMRCAAVSGCLGMIIWFWGNLSGNDLETRYFRLAAQLQFIHYMTFFGFATFMNLGARKERLVAGSSLLGSFSLLASLHLAPFLCEPVPF